MSIRNVNICTNLNKELKPNKSNKLMYFRLDDDKLLENYKTIWSKIKDLKNIELNALPVYEF